MESERNEKFDSQTEFARIKEGVKDFLTANPGLKIEDYIDEKLDVAQTNKLLAFSSRNKNYSEIKRYIALLKNWRIKAADNKDKEIKTIGSLDTIEIKKTKEVTLKLNSSQLSIIFYLFKDKKVINHNIPHTEYSKIVELLTGYKAEPIRKKFCKKDLSELSDSKNDFEQVIKAFEEMIKVLKESKDKLI
jgi:hypothetical protein